MGINTPALIKAIDSRLTDLKWNILILQFKACCRYGHQVWSSANKLGHPYSSAGLFPNTDLSDNLKI